MTEIEQQVVAQHEHTFEDVEENFISEKGRHGHGVKVGIREAVFSKPKVFHCAEYCSDHDQANAGVQCDQCIDQAFVTGPVL